MKDLKNEIQKLRKQQNEIQEKLNNALSLCEHEFANGYTLEPVVYCLICNRDANEIFPNMSYKHISKLV